MRINNHNKALGVVLFSIPYRAFAPDRKLKICETTPFVADM